MIKVFLSTLSFSFIIWLSFIFGATIRKKHYSLKFLILLFFIVFFSGCLANVTYYVYDLNKNKTIEATTNYSESVKVSVIDASFNSELVTRYSEELSTYNAVSETKNINTKNYNDHGLNMLKILTSSSYANTKNTIDLNLVTVEDNEGKINEQYMTSALEYEKEKKPDIILIPMGSEKENKEEEKLINELANSGTMIIASQGNNISEKLYPAQYDNVISVSNMHQSDYENGAKVDIVIEKDKNHQYSTSEAAAYVANVFMNTYNENYKKNLKTFLEDEESTYLQYAVNDLSSKEE